MKMGRKTKSGREKMMGRDKIYIKYCICKFKFIVFVILSLSRMDAHFRVL